MVEMGLETHFLWLLWSKLPAANFERRFHPCLLWFEVPSPGNVDLRISEIYYILRLATSFRVAAAFCREEISVNELAKHSNTVSHALKICHLLQMYFIGIAHSSSISPSFQILVQEVIGPNSITMAAVGAQSSSSQGTKSIHQSETGTFHELRESLPRKETMTQNHTYHHYRNAPFGQK